MHRIGKIKNGETVWRWAQSAANSSLQNSLFNRENTGSLYVLEGRFPQNLPDFPVGKGFRGFILKNGTGNNRELSGEYTLGRASIQNN